MDSRANGFRQPQAPERDRWRASSQHDAKMRVLQVRHAMLIQVLSGQKRLCQPHGDIIVRAGEFLLLPAHSSWRVVNESLQEGYRAAALLMNQELLCNFVRQYESNGQRINQAVWLARSLHLNEAFQSAAASVTQRLPESIVQHRMTELLLWLGELGWRFDTAQATTSDQLIRLMRAHLDTPWTKEKAALALNMSVSTLQRRLADESMSFKMLLRQLRMSYALHLLAHSRHSIQAVSMACGYASPGRFAAAFVRHHGFSPSSVKSFRQP